MVSLNRKYAVLLNSMNLLLLGVGPLIIPQPFFTADFGLSTIWLVIVFLISYNSAEFQGLFICKKNKVQQSDAIDNNSQQNLVMHVYTKKEQIPNNQNLNINSQLLQKTAVVYYHAQQLKILFGMKWMLLPQIVASIYLAGVSISKCIIKGKTLSQVILFLDGCVFYQWRCIYFQKYLKNSFYAKFISIGLMIFGTICLILKNGQVSRVITKQGSLFDFSNFSQIFSNTVFSIMFHHSLPASVVKLKILNQEIFFVRYAFLISGTTTIIITFTRYINNDKIEF